MTNESESEQVSISRELVEEALDDIRSARKAEFILRWALGEDPNGELVNGHLFRESSEQCLVRGCEMVTGYEEFCECPAPMEAFDAYEPGDDDDW